MENEDKSDAQTRLHQPELRPVLAKPHKPKLRDPLDRARHNQPTQRECTKQKDAQLEHGDVDGAASAPLQIRED